MTRGNCKGRVLRRCLEESETQLETTVERTLVEARFRGGTELARAIEKIIRRED